MAHRAPYLLIAYDGSPGEATAVRAAARLFSNVGGAQDGRTDARGVPCREDRANLGCPEDGDIG
jgi:hypothetical protein